MHLTNLDSDKFKRILVDRVSFLSSPSKSKKYLDKRITYERKKRYTFQVSHIYAIDSHVKIIELYNENCPSFKPGQYIALTLFLEHCFMTRSYFLVGTQKEAENGYFKIAVIHTEDKMDAYLFSTIKVGDSVVTSNPSGHFYHSSIRDKNHVVAIADAIGLPPILSMLQAIIEGEVDYTMVLFYNAKQESDLFYKPLLDAFDEKTTRIQVFYVLSEEEKDTYLKGYVSLDKIKGYIDYNTSIFISGNEGMLKYLNKELEPLHLPKKFIRYNAFLPRCNIRKVQEYVLSIYIQDEKYEIKCYNNKTLMQSITESGIYIPSKCHNGSCLLCRSELLLGRVKIINDHRKEGDKRYNYIHPCVTYPCSDVEIIVR